MSQVVGIFPGQAELLLAGYKAGIADDVPAGLCHYGNAHNDAYRGVIFLFVFAFQLG